MKVKPVTMSKTTQLFKATTIDFLIIPNVPIFLTNVKGNAAEIRVA